VSQGKRSDGENGVFIWKDVALSPGENKISSRAKSGDQIITDECVWRLSSP
jgi:hypothetical protein